jgi:hypothetical protein
MPALIEASPNVKKLLLQKQPFTVVWVDLSGELGTEPDNLVLHVEASTAEEAAEIAAAKMRDERYGGRDTNYMIPAVFPGHHKSQYGYSVL